MAKSWIATMLVLLFWVAFISVGEIRSEKNKIDDLIREFQTVEQIPESKIEIVADDGMPFPMMFSIMSAMLGLASVVGIYAIGMQMSASRRSVAKATFALFLEMTVAIGALNWVFVLVRRLVEDKILASDYPQFREKLLDSAAPSLMAAEALIYLGMMLVGCICAMLMMRSTVWGIVSMITGMLGGVAGSILVTSLLEKNAVLIAAVVGAVAVLAVVCWRLIVTQSVLGATFFKVR